ncbi:branched-chain amino acid ABC transporter permease [Paradesulfitobacterium aromaticivorans]
MQTLIFQSLVMGILQGSIYSLIAMGLSLIFGVMKIINFAHGEFLMVSMYASFFLFTFFNIDPYLSIVFTIPFLFAFGALIYWFLIKPILKAPESSQILLTVGIGLILQNLALSLFSLDYRTISLDYAQIKFTLAGAVIGLPYLIAFIISGLVALTLFYVMGETEFGRQIRAAAEDPDAASLVGINVKRVFTLSFGLGIASLAVAGGVLVPLYYTSPEVGALFSLRAFVIVVLGGMGNMTGAFWGGLIIGLVEALGSIIMPGSLAPILTFIVFIALLALRPQGLFGGAKL